MYVLAERLLLKSGRGEFRGSRFGQIDRGF
jgi:hypothetical protein